MRDAFGGAFMIRLFLVFIIIYVFFTAIALNYAKAFKVKNQVIEYLENNEISSIKDMPASEFDKMQDYFDTEILGNMNYQVDVSCPRMSANDDYYCGNGLLIIKRESTNANKLGDYYTVTTYFKWNIGFFRVLLDFGNNSSTDTSGEVGTWAISGETRPIVSS